MPTRRLCPEARRDEREVDAHVGGGDELPGPPQGVHPEEPPRIEFGGDRRRRQPRAQRHRRHGRAEVLRLHRAERGDTGRRITVPCGRHRLDALRRETHATDFAASCVPGMHRRRPPDACRRRRRVVVAPR